jgi:flagellar M-ring protein FliF
MASLIDNWNSASVTARVAFAAAAAVILAGAVLLAVWALHDERQPLFTELDPRDAAAIAAELERMKVPYTVADDGATILVDKAAVHSTRLKIMGKGVDLKGTVGFEIFNNTDFGMTEFAQKINYQRALQGELSRTIGALAEVKSARVHLVLPESGLLRKSAAKPKASVTLVVRGAERLSPEQIQGIQRLVAASVAEMEPAAVTVLDQQGVALSRRAEPEGEAGGGPRLDAKREYEAYLARKVGGVLDQAFGPGRGIVSVDVALDYDQVKVTREDLLPAGREGGGAIVRRRETTQSPATYATALPAVDGAREPYRRPTSTTSEVEYQHGRRVEQSVSAPGAVRRISVGVLLPRDIPQAEADSLKQVIAMTAGLDTARGDAIAFSWVGPGPATRAAPAQEPEIKLQPARSMSPRILPMIEHADPLLWWGLAALAALGVALAAVALVRRRRSRGLSEKQREETLSQIRTWTAQNG